MSRYQKGFFCAIFASLCYSVMTFFAKLTVEVAPITLVFFRCIICIIILYPIVLKKKKMHKIQQKKLFLLKIFLGFVHLICFYYAIKNLFFVTDAIALSSTGGLFIPLISYLLYKTKVSKINILSIMIGFIGVILILKPGFDCFNIAGIFGLVSGFSLGFAKVTLGKLMKTEYLYTILLYVFIGNALISFVPMLYHPLNFANPMMWFYIALISTIGLVFQIFHAKAYYYVSANKISVVFYSVILFNGIFEWAFYHKIPDYLKIIGAFLIIAGSLLTLVRKKEAASST